MSKSIRTDITPAEAAAALALKGYYRDDHSELHPYGSGTPVYGFAICNGYTVLLLDAPVFCINKVYLDEAGDLHLSQQSVGGTIDRRNIKDMVAAISDANEGTIKSCRVDIASILKI